MMKIAIRADGLPGLLDQAPDGIEYLSLDCFDTLLWRNVHAPVDVFADLPFPGGAMQPRVSAENAARRVAINKHRRHDVTLDEIHAYLTPDTQPEERAALIEAELEAEARHCFAFAPVRDLMVEAKRRGLKIILVSDMYLSEERLRTLIGRTAGEEVLALIDRIFVSSEYGYGKALGLFGDVLKELGVKPEAVLHVGDNPVSDQEAPSELGIHTAHFIQFDEIAQQRLRLEATAASMMEPGARVSVPVIQGHRAQISTRTNDDPVFAFGHDVLGPIMHGFASWLRDEAEEMSRRAGKPVKLLFLMRDGHLPAKAFATLYPEWADRIASIDLSRFTAHAASFTDAKAIESWLVPQLRANDAGGPHLARQLLFSEDEIAGIGEMEGNFLERVMRPEMLDKIIERSAAFRERVLAHLRMHGVEDGDAVMFVDTGYAGSTQNIIEPVLRDRMNLTVAGRYMILLEFWRAGNDKKGLIDIRHYDYNALAAIYSDSSVIEQFCPIGRGSVIDYLDDGTAIYDAHTINLRQSTCRARAQSACLSYLRDAGSAQVAPPRSDDADGRRRAAMAALCRFLFLPLASEVEMLASFQHDRNLGTDWMIQMMDADAARNSLRRRGLDRFLVHYNTRRGHSALSGHPPISRLAA